MCIGVARPMVAALDDAVTASMDTVTVKRSLRDPMRILGRLNAKGGGGSAKALFLPPPRLLIVESTRQACNSASLLASASREV